MMHLQQKRGDRIQSALCSRGLSVVLVNSLGTYVWEKPIVAACGIVPVVADVPVFFQWMRHGERYGTHDMRHGVSQCTSQGVSHRLSHGHSCHMVYPIVHPMVRPMDKSMGQCWGIPLDMDIPYDECSHGVSHRPPCFFHGPYHGLSYGTPRGVHPMNTSVIWRIQWYIPLCTPWDLLVYAMGSPCVRHGI